MKKKIILFPVNGWLKREESIKDISRKIQERETRLGIPQKIKKKPYKG